MVSNVGQVDNGQTTPTARGVSALPKLHWRQLDLLMYCMDTSDGDEYVAVTPGKPPRVVWKHHNFFRTHAQIKPLVDLGLLELVRTEIYPNGASCEIYTASQKARRMITEHLASLRELSRARYEAAEAKRQAEIQALYRQGLIQALEQQYGGNYFIPSLQDDITESKTPFLDTPMPLYAPKREGLPITIREYLITLWFEVLPDEAMQLIKDFFMWADALGEDEAMKMMKDRWGEDDEPPTYGNIGWVDDQDE